LKLAFWPHPLCLDYAWPVAGGWRHILRPGVLALTLLATTLWLFIKKPFIGDPLNKISGQDILKTVSLLHISTALCAVIILLF
jgi:hypothetical protein